MNSGISQKGGHAQLTGLDEAAEVGEMVGVAIGDSFEAVEGNVARNREAGDSGGFHVDEDCLMLFRKGPLFVNVRYVIEGDEADAPVGSCGKTLASKVVDDLGYGVCPRRLEGASEGSGPSVGDEYVGLSLRKGAPHGACGSGRSHASGDGDGFVPGNMASPEIGFNPLPVAHERFEFAGQGGDDGDPAPGA